MLRPEVGDLSGLHVWSRNALDGRWRLESVTNVPSTYPPAPNTHLLVLMCLHNLCKQGDSAESTVIEDKSKTKAELLADLVELRGRVAELEALEATRKGVGDAAASLEADHRALVRNAVYGIYATSVKDRFLTANLALAEMLGYETQAELLSVRPSEIYENPAAREELIEKHRDAERVEGVEVRWRRKDGSRITVRLGG